MVTRRDASAPWAEPVLLTASDVLSLPDDGWRYELVEGRLIREPPTSFEHGGIEARLASELQRFVDLHALGRVVSGEPGFLISRPHEPDTVLAPDIAFVATDHLPPPAERTSFPHLAPDLVVEVASASQSRPQMAAKARRWLDSGARLVWVIWPADRTVTVWHAGSRDPIETVDEAGSLDGGAILPGFSYPLTALFAQSGA